MLANARLFALLILALFASSTGAAPPESADVQLGPALGREHVQRFRVGIQIIAEAGPCEAIVATTPIPIDWPEQQVKIVEDDLSPSVQDLQYRVIDGSVKQMVLTIPYLAAGEECHAITTLEITRRELKAPEETEALILPKKLDKDLRAYLAASPGIETRHAKIRSLAKDLVKDKASAWEQVEALYDWVRDNVKYSEGGFKGAAQALKDKKGDCEELSSLFIALCRANGIPARTVWVPGHCYPEFYLVDPRGHGYWFPCQAAGARDFGGIVEQRPVLQKGDNFSDPDRPGRKLRYVSEFISVRRAAAKPTVRFIRELVAD
jgi:hypothetical protein